MSKEKSIKTNRGRIKFILKDKGGFAYDNTLDEDN